MVSLWSNEARISFCLSVQLPSFRVFLTPPLSLLLLSVCCLGCVSVSLSREPLLQEEKYSEQGELGVCLSPGKGFCSPVGLLPSLFHQEGCLHCICYNPINTQ